MYSIRLRNGLKKLDKALVMGILNLSPDSFYDGGRNTNTLAILKKIEQMRKDGMDILDIGAFSSRPGAEIPEGKEEITRLSRHLKEIIKSFPDLAISVDTFRASVARYCLDEGVEIINDISGGTFDPEILPVVGQYQAPYIIMHMQNQPKNMQDNPSYQDVSQDIMRYFSEQIRQAQEYHIHDIILDPGFGFGKTIEQNYRILKDLDIFHLLACPILVGVSRKSMIQKLLDCSAEEALNGTSIVHSLALLNGANILRVHDVKEASECIKLINFYKQ